MPPCKTKLNLRQDLNELDHANMTDIITVIGHIIYSAIRIKWLLNN